MTVHTIVRDIPLSKLIASPHNVRRTGRETGIEELAASIAAHGVLQNLVVRPVANGKRPADKFEVIAGGRRLAAITLLVKRKQVKSSVALPCIIRDVDEVEEASLAENVVREPLHPADQYEAFRRLHDDHGLGVEDIAARFGVTPHVVKQRLRLGAVSPRLMALYRDGGVSLDQLSAFTLTTIMPGRTPSGMGCPGTSPPRRFAGH
jgi:ParB family chromosome partitioning protein